jgi:hypothetical protein
MIERRRPERAEVQVDGVIAIEETVLCAVSPHAACLDWIDG